MGNTESSSQFPARRPPASGDRDETESDSSLEKALKVGATVAGGALLALGAYSLASSSPSTSDADERKPANHTESVTLQRSYGGSPSASRYRDETESQSSSSSLEKTLKVGAAVAGGALLAFGAYSLASSSSNSSTSDSDEQRKPANHTEGFYGSSISSAAQLPQYPSHLGDLDEPSFSGTIKIMTYNIWLREDVKVQERMNAIGKLIQEHSPDIILLQEVTPNIYEIFQSSYWSNVYKCSVPEEEATRKNICMLLLSKLPVKKSTYIPFTSSDGKGLCVVWIDTGKNKLIVSTCHLKRPTSSEETKSTERVAQAKEALSLLNSLAAPNIVLGGDMNWNEDYDGPFPLAGKWKDAWSLLRPGEDGWTYDTKSNGMLRSSNPLQRRLDRFLCKMKDFKSVDIDMIGLEPIPRISYKNKPVYPSDHYGLILTVSLK